MSYSAPHFPILGDPLIRVFEDQPSLSSYLRRTNGNIIHVEFIPLPSPKELFPSSEALQRLCRADSLSAIGKHGIALASYSLEAQENVSLHLYEAEFYRDARVLAHAVKGKYPELLYTTIIRGAQLQGGKASDTTHLYNEEERGRIFHENRSADDPRGQELTRLRRWHWPYYGAVDTTPHFILDIFTYWSHQQKTKGDGAGAAFLEQAIPHPSGSTLKDATWEAAEWIRRRMDSNPEGLIESKSKFPESIQNQVWQDSDDAYMHTDGTLANSQQGVASIEVQARTYDALLALSVLFPDKAEEMLMRAARLRQIILSAFWVEETKSLSDGEVVRKYFALGSDRDSAGRLRILKVLKSNAAHVLDTELLTGMEPDIVTMREGLIETLCTPELWSSRGLRTLATNEVRYYAHSYHNGSIWPWDNATFARGLAKHGYIQAAGYVYQKGIDIVHQTKLYPEKVCGDVTREPLDHWIVDSITSEGEVLRISQPPQLIQAFTLAAYMEAEAFSADIPSNKMYQYRDTRTKDFDIQILERLRDLDDKEQKEGIFTATKKWDGVQSVSLHQPYLPDTGVFNKAAVE